MSSRTAVLNQALARVDQLTHDLALEKNRVDQLTHDLASEKKRSLARTDKKTA